MNARPRVERHRFAGNGYHLEASEMVDCVLGGRTESAVLPLDTTTSVMATLDRVRNAW